MQQKRLCFYTAKELLQGYKSKQITPSQVIEDILKRIEEVNHHVNAYCFVEEKEKLLQQAKESEGMNTI